MGNKTLVWLILILGFLLIMFLNFLLLGNNPQGMGEVVKTLPIEESTYASEQEQKNQLKNHKKPQNKKNIS